jgi:hypothetical protein
VHGEIAEELQNHINDHVEALLESGVRVEEAEEQAVEAMGDPEEIGRELNKEHRPLIEGMLTLTNLITAIGILYCIWAFLFVGFYGLLSLDSLNYSVERDHILYTQKLEGKQKVGAITYKLNKMTVTDDNTLLITYSTYGDNLDTILRGWTSPALMAYDEKGKAYHTKGSKNTGLYPRGQILIDDFDSSRGDTIVLKAPSYYGDVVFPIPLQGVKE